MQQDEVRSEGSRNANTPVPKLQHVHTKCTVAYLPTKCEGSRKSKWRRRGVRGLLGTSRRKSMSSVGDAENDPHSIRPRRGFFVRGQTGRSHCPSHLMRAQLEYLCEVTLAPRTSEPFDELSARIFVPGEPRTGDTWRNPREETRSQH